MDAQTQSRARLTRHAIERHSRLLVDALDASLVELSPECVRWGAVCDPRCWLTPNAACGDAPSDTLRRHILTFAARYCAAADDVERFIRAGAAGHDCDAKAAFRDELLTATRDLLHAMDRWIRDDASTTDAKTERPISPFPQYVPRVVPRADAGVYVVGNAPTTVARGAV